MYNSKEARQHPAYPNSVENVSNLDTRDQKKRDDWVGVVVAAALGLFLLINPETEPANAQTPDLNGCMDPSSVLMNPIKVISVGGSTHIRFETATILVNQDSWRLNRTEQNGEHKVVESGRTPADGGKKYDLIDLQIPPAPSYKLETITLSGDTCSLGTWGEANTIIPRAFIPHVSTSRRR